MDQATGFLKLLDPKADKLLFAAYDYRKIEKGRQFYGSYGATKNKLKELNENVFCIYVTINETKDKNRKKDNVKRCRAIWVEDDDPREKPRDDFPIKPSIIVRSSGTEKEGKFHYYWLTSTTKFDEWEKVMNTMVQEHGCDKNARDVVRVMRLPGFNHRKDLKQPWPCTLIEDNGRVYRWFEIKKSFPQSEKIKKLSQKDSTNSTQQLESDYSEDEAIQALMNSENYHGSLVSISMSLTNKEISRELQFSTLFGLMHRIPKGSRRPEWEHRISDEHLYECIDTAIKKKEGEDDEVSIDELKYKEEGIVFTPVEVIFPPGRMGKLCEEILEMAPYPNREVALAGGMGLISGIVGRTYNVLGMGLNLYIAILADSGIGKANLKDSINMALRAGGGKLNVGTSFVGKSRFTGPKAIFGMLSSGLSRISILEEAGLISESTAGDSSGITRVLLDLYTSSGYGKWAGDEGYSSKDDSISAVHSPSLSIVNVSTPKSFLKALKSKSADLSGEVARLWMMRSMHEKPYFNQDRRFDYSKEHISIMGKLIAKALPNQPADSELRVINMNVPAAMFKDADKWVDRENSYLRDGDYLRRTLCSRAWAKIVKMASVASVYNGKNEVGAEEYKWAADCVEKELQSIHESFTYETSDDLSNIAKSIIAPAIVNSLLGKFKDEKKNAGKDLAKYGIVTHYGICQILKNNIIIKEIDDDTSKPNPRTGIDKVLFYMTRSGYLSQLDAKTMKKFGSRSKIGYRITTDFQLLHMEDK